MLLVIFLCLSLLTFIFTIYIVYFAKMVSLQHILGAAKTGDLIYFRWNKMSMEMNYMTPFTHVGMVLVHPDKGYKYILETHSARDLEYLGLNTAGINIYPLEMRVNTYQGRTFYARLNTHIPLNKVIEIIPKIRQYRKTIPFDENYKQRFLTNCMLNRKHQHRPNTRLYCSEFVGLCLKDLGVLPNTFVHECLLPHEFMNIMDNKGNYLYDSLQQISV